MILHELQLPWYLHDNIANYSQLNESVYDTNRLALYVNHFTCIVLKKRRRKSFAKP